VDFVVTLGGPIPEPQVLGRLERQIQSGSVAIRELRAARCEDVAEALALSLELALRPTEEEAPPSEPSAPTLLDTAPVTAESPRLAGDAAFAEKTADGESRPLWSLGLQGTALSGVAPSLMPGLALSVGLAAGGGRASARVSLRGNYRETDASNANPAMRVALIAARPEGCPWAWGLREFWLEPCFGIDVGVLRTEGSSERGRTDAGVWFGAAAHVRAVWRVAAPLALEAEVGALVPIVRYALEHHAGSAEAFHTESVGLAVGLGAAWLP
jgi:hypothetical protein